MSPTAGRGKGKKRARSVEGLLETTSAGSPSTGARALDAQARMKKAKSLEEYLDRCDEDAEEDGNSVSAASASDSLKKRNFVDKCIVKMKSLMTGRRQKDGTAAGVDTSK